MLDALASSYASYAATNGLPTPATYGRKCGASSVTADPWHSSVNRLQATMGGRGWPLFELRSKYWAMPLGAPIYALRASALSISASACSLARISLDNSEIYIDPSLTHWPTATVNDTINPTPRVLRTGTAAYDNLARAAQLTYWPTVNAQIIEAKPNPPITRNRKPTDPQIGLADVAVHVMPWPTVTATERSGQGPKNSSLMQDVRPTPWPTAKAQNQHGSGPSRVANRLDLQTATQLAPWATPNVPNGGRQASPERMTLTGQTPDGQKRQVDLNFQAQSLTLAPLPTAAAARDWKSGESHLHGQNARPLNEVVLLYPVSTPTASDATAGARIPTRKAGKNPGLIYTARLHPGPSPTSSAATAKPARCQLNPFFSLWLMGFPTAWALAGLNALTRSPPTKSPIARRSSKARATPSSPS